MQHYDSDREDVFRRKRQMRLRRERRRKRNRQRMIRRLLACGIVILLAVLLIFGISRIWKSFHSGESSGSDSPAVRSSLDSVAPSEIPAPIPDPSASHRAELSAASQAAMQSSLMNIPKSPDAQGMISVGNTRILSGYQIRSNSSAAYPPESDVQSGHALLVDLSSNTIVAQKDGMSQIYPASMTKILTILVAAEHVTNLDDTFTVTQEISDFTYKNGCSMAGFQVGDTMTIRDLFYGTILPSGGDAAMSLATYTAGSQDAFVELMNQKVQELGLSGSAHFTNCIGIFNESNTCTAADMAMILKAAIENDWCREVLSTKRYTTGPTAEHPDGIELSNWFLRKIEDKDSGGIVTGAKTGYVVQSGNCAASYFVSDGGIPYICVTANAHSSWRCIYDHVAMYRNYTK